MLPYLKLLDNVAILEYVNRLINKLDSKLFDNQINIYHIDSLLYSFAFGNLLNIQSLVGEGFVHSEGRSCLPFKFVGHNSPSRDCINGIYSIINNLDITKNHDYRMQISISGKSINANTDLYLTNILKASNIFCYFPLKLSTSCGNYLFYSASCYNLSKSASFLSNMSLDFNRSLIYLVNNYPNIFCKIMNVDFFVGKIYSLMSQYNLSTTIQAGWNNMFALVIDTRKSYSYFSTCYSFYDGFTYNSFRHCVDTSLGDMVNLSNYTSIAFVFGMSNISYEKFQEYGMDFIFSCFV